MTWRAAVATRLRRHGRRGDAADGADHTGGRSEGQPSPDRLSGVAPNRGIWGRTDAGAAHDVTVDPPERGVGLAWREESLMPQPTRDAALG